MTQEPGTAQVPDPDRETRTEQVTRVLREEVLTGQYRPGERLPSERDLARRFETTRPIVRVAIKKLEQLGLAVVQPGGARVAPLEDASLDAVGHLLALQSPPDPRLVDQVFEVMGALIAESARILVERGDDDALDRARELLARLLARDLADAEETALILQLAQLFTDASDNLVLRMIRRGLMAEMAQRLPALPVQPQPAKALPLRRKLDRAIAARDGAAAHEAVHALWSDHRARTVRALAEAQTGR